MKKTDKDRVGLALQMLKKYLFASNPTGANSIYGINRYKDGVSHIKVLASVNGAIIDITLYCANLCGYRRDRDGAIMGRGISIEDIASAIKLELGWEITGRRL